LSFAAAGLVLVAIDLGAAYRMLAEPHARAPIEERRSCASKAKSLATSSTVMERHTQVRRP
jgi:hypothetical protein